MLLRPTLLLPLVALFGPTAQAQDTTAGERVFGQCRSCHQIGEAARNVVGPQLNGLFGRRAGTVEGYSYSPANKGSEIVWTDDAFRDYIKDPKAKMPGTKMIYAGLKEDGRIADLIAFLRQFDAAGRKGTP